MALPGLLISNDISFDLRRSEWDGFHHEFSDTGADGIVFVDLASGKETGTANNRPSFKSSKIFLTKDSQ